MMKDKNYNNQSPMKTIDDLLEELKQAVHWDMQTAIKAGSSISLKDWDEMKKWWFSRLIGMKIVLLHLYSLYDVKWFEVEIKKYIEEYDINKPNQK